MAAAIARGGGGSGGGGSRGGGGFVPHSGAGAGAGAGEESSSQEHGRNGSSSSMAGGCKSLLLSLILAIFVTSILSNSRVCPSNISGFQPGEVFMIRNIANLVPVMKNGSLECNVALEFAVTTLEVNKVLQLGWSASNFYFGVRC
ncbi:uncharacterized protein LOC130731219 [Lotus japonicus]|uniref:uncharacterized protein LOC130731219 n=1 Tax=Lotus japonicus TaxID=34305 RepID=UPI002586D37E|nr:uncharacterized protein LOC130731219 [Lotus japonicus]